MSWALRQGGGGSRQGHTRERRATDDTHVLPFTLRALKHTRHAAKARARACTHLPQRCQRDVARAHRRAQAQRPPYAAAAAAAEASPAASPRAALAVVEVKRHERAAGWVQPRAADGAQAAAAGARDDGLAQHLW
jgi:hypothetical protein